MTAIFAVSSMALPPGPGGDKPWHVLGYFCLAVVVVRALAGGLPRRIHLRTAVRVIVIVVLYGMSDEWHQTFVPGRTAAFDDLVADAIGALVGTGACWAWGIIAAPSRDEL